MQRVNMRRVAWGVTAVGVCLMAGATTSVSGQGRRPAAQAETALTRTPDGQPNIQGFWKTDAYTADIETGLPDDETATIQGQAPPDRSKAVSAVIDPPDGKIPYQPWALTRRDSIPSFRRGPTSRGVPKTVRDIRPRTFCLHTPPRAMFTDFQVIQTPTQVVIAWEFNHAFRVVHMDGRPPLPETVKLAMGDSRGRWEGSTLVVETRNFNDWDWFDYTGSFHSNALTMVERFTLLNPTTIDYRATMTDPKVFTTPWTLTLQLDRSRGPDDRYEMLEHACVEGERGVSALLEDSKP